MCLAWIIEADLPWDGFPKVPMTLPGSSALSVGKILFTAKVGNRSEARERINSFDPELRLPFFELLNNIG